MAARNRPRGALVKDEPNADAHEEITMWSQIKTDLRALGQLQKKQQDKAEQITSLQEHVEEQGKRNESKSITLAQLPG